MMVSPYVFKSKAVRALKGNWQTALLVSFFSALPLTILQLFQATKLPDLSQFTTYEGMNAAVRAIPSQTWTLMGLIGGLSLVLTPVLALGCNKYFLERLRKQELGFKGLFSRMGSFGKALLLYLLMYVKTFLWTLLFVVPGIMAALRYAMAPFYMADDPALSPLEAIRKSKDAMKDQKTNLLMLELSFVIWLLAAMLAEMLFSGFSYILALVVSQFIQLAMATYLNASVASFYLAASVPEGMRDAQTEAAQWLKNFSNGSFNRRSFGNDSSQPDDTADGDDEASGFSAPDEAHREKPSEANGDQPAVDAGQTQNPKPGEKDGQNS